jgi:hypothetical protein
VGGTFEEGSLQVDESEQFFGEKRRGLLFGEEFGHDTQTDDGREVSFFGRTAWVKVTGFLVP